jgi:hypothetical protein
MTCSFGTFLDRQLRDRLVSGVSDKQLQNALLAEGNTLTFESACQKARNLELVNNQQLQMVKIERVDQLEFQQPRYRLQPTTKGADHPTKSRNARGNSLSIIISKLNFA